VVNSSSNDCSGYNEPKSDYVTAPGMQYEAQRNCQSEFMLSLGAPIDTCRQIVNDRH
jgi:hypothetical protein